MKREDSSTERQSTSFVSLTPDSDRLPPWVKALYSSVLGVIVALLIISMFVCAIFFLLGQLGMTFSGDGSLAGAFSVPTSTPTFRPVNSRCCVDRHRPGIRIANHPGDDRRGR
jgi:hypothetical protein